MGVNVSQRSFRRQAPDVEPLGCPVLNVLIVKRNTEAAKQATSCWVAPMIGAMFFFFLAGLIISQRMQPVLEDKKINAYNLTVIPFKTILLISQEY
jgi:hypothetical protein